MIINNVLLAINVRWWNAEAAYALNLARGLKKAGIKVRMIVNPGSPVHLKAQENEIPVVTDILLDSRSPSVHRRNYIRIKQLVEQHGIQVINSFKSNGAFLFSLVKRRYPRIVYIKTRGEARPPRKNVLNKFLYGVKGCDGLIAVGSPVRSWLEALDLGEQRIETIYYGDTPVTVDAETGKSKMKSDLDIPGDARVVILLGRIQKVKGHMVLLEAMHRITDPTCYLMLLIKDPDEFPDELAAIKETAARYGLLDRLIIKGFQANLGDILKCGDLGVVPSLASEVNCRVTVELFSLGIPVLAFPTGTLPDLIRHEGNGYLCRAATSDELVRGIDWMLADGERLKALGRAARQSYLDHYTLEEMAARTIQFYQLRRSAGNSIEPATVS